MTRCGWRISTGEVSRPAGQGFGGYSRFRGRSRRSMVFASPEMASKVVAVRNPRHDRAPEGAVGCDGIHDAIGADVSGRVVENRHSKVHVGSMKSAGGRNTSAPFRPGPAVRADTEEMARPETVSLESAQLKKSDEDAHSSAVRSRVVVIRQHAWQFLTLVMRARCCVPTSMTRSMEVSRGSKI